MLCGTAKGVPYTVVHSYIFEVKFPAQAKLERGTRLRTGIEPGTPNSSINSSCDCMQTYGKVRTQRIDIKKHRFIIQIAVLTEFIDENDAIS